MNNLRAITVRYYVPVLHWTVECDASDPMTHTSFLDYCVTMVPLTREAFTIDLFDINMYFINFIDVNGTAKSKIQA